MIIYDWEKDNKKRKGVFDNIINTNYKDVCPRCGGKKNMFGIQKFEGGIFTCKWVDYNLCNQCGYEWKD